MTAPWHAEEELDTRDDAEHRAAMEYLIAQPSASPMATTFVDWATFWNIDRKADDWTFEDVLARGRGHALYAGHKTGKSLLMLYISAVVALRPGNVVVYLDYEMSEEDLHERLVDMGYGPTDDLSRLRYALLPSLPPLDTPEGARALDELLDGVQEQHPDDHLTVIIDTTARAVQGDEDKADTIRSFYRWTGIGLKRRGATWARLDHAGKDATKGQRSTSAKGDDVDVVWRVERDDTGLSLRRDIARMNWVPERVAFLRLDDPLRYARADVAWPAGTADCAADLDSLTIAIDASSTTALAALRDAGKSRRKAVVLAALKYRKEGA
ncbi:MAG TPA: AAA family ATPase [Ilumatobacteraceae bacterium]|nr:AAA family ATPase [Ilumatobacteraceae bacterium]